MPASYAYAPDAWKAILEQKGWTNQKVAQHCNFSTEHVANILNGTTKTARRDTREKAKRGFTALGATEAEIATLFV